VLRTLAKSAYHFVTITPASHARVLARREGEEAKDLRDVFGWSLPFRPSLLAPELLRLLEEASAVEEVGGLLKSRLRVSSLHGRLFLHSAYPTESRHAVFFGPDTYRFADFIAAELPGLGRVERIVDIGTGSGAGGIVAGRLTPGTRITLSDLNPHALRLAAANAAHHGVEAEIVEGPDLDAVKGPIDLVLANPPYMIDESDRAYRDGGGMHGAELSQHWALAAAGRLERGGHILLYTGVAILGGRDALREALEQHLPALGCSLRYRELDPDLFGEELAKPAYRDVERIAAVGAVIRRD
jgi:methylase of polypeptide subunit release factors